MDVLFLRHEDPHVWDAVTSLYFFFISITFSRRQEIKYITKRRAMQQDPERLKQIADIRRRESGEEVSND